MSQFPCTSCGACCSNINGINFLSEYNRGGVCDKLVDNQCTIYEKRPLLCRVDEAYDQMFSSIMTREAFYLENAKACNALQEKMGISTSYRIPLDSF